MCIVVIRLFRYSLKEILLEWLKELVNCERSYRKIETSQRNVCTRNIIIKAIDWPLYHQHGVKFT